MANTDVRIFYMCPKCMEPALEQTSCPTCGGERITCRPGEVDDPCRKPLMLPTGQVRSRAPIWWLVAIGALDSYPGDQLQK